MKLPVFLSTVSGLIFGMCMVFVYNSLDVAKIYKILIVIAFLGLIVSFILLAYNQSPKNDDEM